MSFKVDESTGSILDYETRIMNLTEANLTNEPKWIHEYSLINAFNLKSTLPNEFDTLINKALEDPYGEIYEKLQKFYLKSSEVKRNCDRKCRLDFLCSFKQARKDNFIKC
jgi:sphingomyelin phosphodiesterase